MSNNPRIRQGERNIIDVNAKHSPNKATVRKTFYASNSNDVSRRTVSLPEQSQPINFQLGLTSMCCLYMIVNIGNQVKALLNGIAYFFESFSRIFLYSFCYRPVHKRGIILVPIGLLICFLTEIFPKSPKCNLILTMAIIVSTGYKSLPRHNVRFQSLLFFSTVLSVPLDVYAIIIFKLPTSTSIMVTLTTTIKLILIYRFLIYSLNAQMTRKILDRLVTLYST